MTVIGGYLGAGKTTLINRLLTGAHGRRLMVMVNDFGSVNIDAALLARASDDTLELTNGCVCCTMGADLFMAVGDVLYRPDRPDHLIIEASGVADPARIAEVARAEPDLRYAGILTVVDTLNIAGLLADPRIAAQVAGQIRAADYLYFAKGALVPQTGAVLNALSQAPILPDGCDVGPYLWDVEAALPQAAQGHAHFLRWSTACCTLPDLPALQAKLAARPAGLYRLKGFANIDAARFDIQIVGRSVDIAPSPEPGPTQLVGIAPTGAVTQTELDTWWASDPEK